MYLYNNLYIFVKNKLQLDMKMIDMAWLVIGEREYTAKLKTSH